MCRIITEFLFLTSGVLRARVPICVESDYSFSTIDSSFTLNSNEKIILYTLAKLYMKPANLQFVLEQVILLLNISENLRAIGNLFIKSHI